MITKVKTMLYVLKAVSEEFYCMLQRGEGVQTLGNVKLGWQSVRTL